MRQSDVVFLSLLLFCACSRTGQVDVVTGFPVERTLSATEVEVPPVLLYPGYAQVLGDKLMVYEIQRDTLFDFFQLPECRYLFSKGWKGRGPDDFPELNWKSFAPSGDGFEVFGFDMKVRRAALTGSDLRVSVEATITGGGMVNGVFRLAPDRYVMWGQPTDEFEYVMIDREGKVLREFGTYPDLAGRELSPPERLSAYYKMSVLKPDGTRFASFYPVFKHWRLYDAEGGLLREISDQTGVLPPGVLPEEQPEWFQSYYALPVATDRYIYVLCENRRRNEPRHPTTELQVWDWEGNPVGCYELDRQIAPFAIAEQYGKLYGVNQTDIDKIYVYPLPGYND